MNGDRFRPELHLRQPGFIYSACAPFTKHRDRIQKFRDTGNLKPIYKNELGNPCFAHDAAHSDDKDLAKRTISGKILKDRANEIAINPKYDRYQRGLTSLVYNIFDKKIGSGAKVSEKEELVHELQKPVIKKFKRRKVCARFKDNMLDSRFS